MLRYTSVALQNRYKTDHAALLRFDHLYSDNIRQLYESRGLMTLATPVETACVAPRTFDGPPDFGWVDEARRRYAAEGIKVLVMVSPIPACDTQLQQYRSELSSHVDLATWTIPLDQFNDGDRHYTLKGAQQVSAVVGKRIADLGLDGNSK